MRGCRYQRRKELAAEVAGDFGGDFGGEGDGFGHGCGGRGEEGAGMEAGEGCWGGERFPA